MHLKSTIHGLSTALIYVLLIKTLILHFTFVLAPDSLQPGKQENERALISSFYWFPLQV